LQTIQIKKYVFSYEKVLQKTINQLENIIEFDEVYIIAGHKGQQHIGSV